MQERLVKLLINKNYTISTAESCTGGMISSKIVDVADASKVFNMSFITYSNEAKCMLVDVSKETLDKYGAVSEAVAGEMTSGAMKKAKSDVSIAVSGIAGPGGGSKDKPVGMVCFGFGYLGRVYTETKYFGEIGRNKVREETANYAIKRMIEIIEG